jgi:excisionase family DNA binding protein
MEDTLVTISEAAQLLGVSVDTLRRWDKSGKLVAIRKNGTTHRYYTKQDLDLFGSDLLKTAQTWTSTGGELPADWYCSDSEIFKARLNKMQDVLLRDQRTMAIYSLIVSMAGEIGNNSFDHNLGQWPDVPGIFFGYDVNRRIVVLADRGLGILKTLSRVRPELKNDQAALTMAFTETVSGRAPESRGNGLKYVRQVISENLINLFFQSGEADLHLSANSPELYIAKSSTHIHGCLASITF